MNQELLTTIISKLKEKASFTVEQEADCLAISKGWMRFCMSVTRRLR